MQDVSVMLRYDSVRRPGPGLHFVPNDVRTSFHDGSMPSPVRAGSDGALELSILVAWIEVQ